MPLPDWIALHGHLALFSEDAPMPWDQAEAEPEIDPEIAAEAEAYLLAHSALREL